MEGLRKSLAGKSPVSDPLGDWDTMTSSEDSSSDQERDLESFIDQALETDQVLKKKVAEVMKRTLCLFILHQQQQGPGGGQAGQGRKRRRRRALKANTKSPLTNGHNPEGPRASPLNVEDPDCDFIDATVTPPNVTPNNTLIASGSEEGESGSFQGVLGLSAGDNGGHGHGDPESAPVEVAGMDKLIAITEVVPESFLSSGNSVFSLSPGPQDSCTSTSTSTMTPGVDQGTGLIPPVRTQGHSPPLPTRSQGQGKVSITQNAPPRSVPDPTFEGDLVQASIPAPAEQNDSLEGPSTTEGAVSPGDIQEESVNEEVAAALSSRGLRNCEGVPAENKRRDKGRKAAPKPCCYFCQKSFPYLCFLEAHLTTHTHEKPFPCAFSGKEVVQKGDLDIHIRRHVKENPFKCPHPGCTSSFVTGYNLRQHGRIHSGEKPFKCMYSNCGKRFNRQSHLKSHSRTHSGERPFKCNLCGKGFSQKWHLENHIRRHLKEKYYKCSQEGCSSSFVTGTELRDHLRTHSGERPFKCNLCGKGFVGKEKLGDHIRRHLKEKWFKCSHKGCASSFVTGDDLRSHSRVHSGEKPFACPYPNCGKCFAHRATLKQHGRTHSGERPFTCPFQGCGKTFTTSSSLAVHRRTCGAKSNEERLNRSN